MAQRFHMILFSLVTGLAQTDAYAGQESWDRRPLAR